MGTWPSVNASVCDAVNACNVLCPVRVSRLGMLEARGSRFKPATAKPGKKANKQSGGGGGGSKKPQPKADVPTV